MRGWIGRLFLPVLAAGSFGFAVINVLSAHQTPENYTPPIAPSQSPYSNTVAGSGITEPQTENIAVGAHLPGVVETVFVKVGQKVKAGDPLFRQDARQLKADLSVRQAMLDSAQAELSQLEQMPRPESIPPSEAKVQEAKDNLVQLEDALRRNRQLVASRSIGREEFVRSEQTYAAAKSQLARVEAEHKLLLAGSWGPEKQVAKAAVLHAKSEVEKVQTELDRLTVRASVDGEVLQVNVRPGEFVGAPPSQSLIVLGNLDNMHVRVDIDEHDIPRFKPGSSARAVVRGASNQEFDLSFVRVEPYVIPKKSLTGDNTERVDTRVLQVIYALKPKTDNHRVFVGQQVDVFIDLGSAADSDAKSTSELATSKQG